MMFKIAMKSDDYLVRGTLDGRQDDFGVLVRRYLPAVRAIAYARLGNATDTDDATQESFLRAFERLDTLRESAKFGPWVLAIARDRAYKQLRKRMREQRAINVPNVEDLVMDPDVEQRETCERVHRHIAQLDENQREVIVLHYVCGKSIREIAALLDTTSNTVKKRLQRARESLSRTTLRELAGTRTSEGTSEQQALRIMGLVGTMGVAWKASAGTAAGAAVAGAGILSGKVLVSLGAVLCIATVLVAVPLMDFLSEPGPSRSTGTELRSPQAELRDDSTTRNSSPATTAHADSAISEGDALRVGIQAETLASGSVVDDQSGGTILGRVSDADSGNGIAGITMTASTGSSNAKVEITGVTDASGSYRITGVPAGRIRVTCGNAVGYPESRPGYSEEYKDVQIKIEQTITDVNFALRTGIVVSGLVLDQNAQPVANAEVLARGKDAGETRIAESGVDGAFVLRGLNATSELYVVARKPGWAEAPTGPFPLTTAGIENLVVVMAPESTLKGQVIDQLGRPVPDVSVTAYPDEPYPFREPSGESGANGSFTIAGLWAGDFDVRLAPPSATQPEGAEHRITMPASGVLDGLILICTTGDLTISGTVTNLDNKPLEGVTVSAVGSFDGQTFTRRATTNSNGDYVIAGLPGGSCEVRIFDTHYMEARHWDVAAGSDGVDFELGPRASITGQVVRADTGEPLERFEVLVHPGLAMKVSPWMEHEFIQIQDEEGRFSLDDVPGSMGFVFVAARAPGYAAAVREIPGVGPGRTIDDIVLRLKPAVHVDGIVVNGEGQPISGALIFAGGMPESTPETGASARTDDAGMFHLDDVDPQMQQVTAYHASYAPGSSPIPAGPPSGELLRIQLSRPAAVEGRLTLNGAALVEEWVQLQYLYDGPIESEQEITDADGVFRFSNLPPGEVTVSVSYWSEGEDGGIQHELSRQASIRPGNVTAVDLPLQSGNAAVTGNVYIQDIPVPGGEVAIVVHTPSGDFSRTVSINMDGNYSATGLPAGSADLTVKAALSEDGPLRVRTAALELLADETATQDIAFGPGGMLAIRVDGADAGVGIVAGDVEYPAVPGLQAFAEIERALVWDGECAAGETVQVAGLEPGQYTAIAVFDPSGDRRIDAEVFTVGENSSQQIVLRP